MPVISVDQPAEPECLGKQWSIGDEDELASLTAYILVGRARHVARILEGTQKQPPRVNERLKAQLRASLVLDPGTDTSHRDGLLFEVIAWIVARTKATPTDVLSDPHLSATDHGADTLKISFDPSSRRLIRATVHEYKCTAHFRKRFREEVLPTFKAYAAGERINELSQSAIGLLSQLSLTEDELLRVYDDLVQRRPLAFQVALTVTPNDFDKSRCVSLFKDFTEVTPSIDDRLGDTLPLVDIRGWFEAFAAKVWQKVDEFDV